MNTHPTHTQVGGWGLWPMIVPIGIDLLLLLLLLLHACVLVCVFSSVHWCVCGGSFVVPKRYLGTLGFIFT